jgi:hypothetical protein
MSIGKQHTWSLCRVENILEEAMKRIVWSFFVLGLLFTGIKGNAQEKQEKAAKQQQEKLAAEASAKEDAAKSESKSTLPEGPPVRVKIVFSEYEGEKKVKSLPYTLLVRQPHGESSWSKIRMGSRVPVATGGSAPGSFNFQYIDVGTNIDCRASHAPDGRYRLSLMMERSWVEGEASFGDGKTPTAEARVGEFREPIIRQFRSDSEVVIREGQTLETNFATDPVSGKVIRLEVTLEVPK